MVPSPPNQTKRPTIFVIDDDPLVLVVIRRAMEGMECLLHSATDTETALQQVKNLDPDVILLEAALTESSGIEVLGQLQEIAPEVPVLYLAACATASTPIAAMKCKAFDYLAKPLEPAKLGQRLRRALAFRQALQSHSQGQVPSASGLVVPTCNAANAEQPLALIGECPAMQEVLKMLGQVAPHDVPVLLRGEQGTGKQAIARQLLLHSRRANGPLVQRHCADFKDPQQEKELLEYLDLSPERTHDPSGRDPERSTLVLEEVGQLPYRLQAKLLQYLQAPCLPGTTNSVERRVGGPASRYRLIATSSEALETLVRSGKFRSDLYYRLSSFVITLPPLRQRHGDLRQLITHCLGRLRWIAQGFGVDHICVSDQALEVLCHHVWPGNLDELESVLQRALIEQQGHVLLGPELQRDMAQDPVIPFRPDMHSLRYQTDWAAFARLRIDRGTDTLHADAIAETEQKLFARVLHHTGGNQSQAARILGITRASLRKKLRVHGLTAPSPTASPQGNSN